MDNHINQENPNNDEKVEDLEFQAFMFHLPCSEYDHLENTLKEYDIGQYIMAFEYKPYPHYHFMVQMSSYEYHKYSKRIVLKYKLCGKPQNGKPRQYGKVKKIEDLEKMKSYTLKDGDFRTNMDEKTINALVEKSFRKLGNKEISEKILEYVSAKNAKYSNIIQTKYHKRHYSIENLRKTIMEFLLCNKIKFTKGSINSYVNYVIQFGDQNIKMNLDELYFYYYEANIST